MREYSELVASLRQFGPSCNISMYVSEAAAAIEALEAENARLQYASDAEKAASVHQGAVVLTLKHALADACTERDALAAELSQIRAQEPVAWISPSDELQLINGERHQTRDIDWFQEDICQLQIGTKLYAHPVAQPVRELSKEAITDLIAEHLSGTYHCTRVWSAWNVGTMTQDDFGDVAESDTPGELADAIIAASKGEKA